MSENTAGTPPSQDSAQQRLKEVETRELGPLYVWRHEQGLSAYTLAERASDLCGTHPDYLAREYLDIEKGRSDPQSITAGPLWKVISSLPGGEGLDVKQLKWWANR